MPQPSVAYAVGRVRAQARKPLGEAQLERLLTAPDYDEALRLLGEMGWPEPEGRDVQALSVGMLEKACAELRSISPDPNLTDLFLLRHDAQNLKALLKARVLGVEPEALSRCGTIPVDVLRHAVTEHNYKLLPEAFKAAMEALEKRVAIDPDPMEIDVRMDQALYQLIGDRLQKGGSEVARKFFSAKADLQNAVTYLRLQAVGQDELKLADFLLPGGSVNKTDWLKLPTRPESLPRLFAAYGRTVTAALIRAAADPRAIPALEKAADDYLLGLFRPLRNQPFSTDVLIGWLLAHERETAAVRLILAGKLNGFPQELIRERLREAYGR